MSHFPVNLLLSPKFSIRTSFCQILPHNLLLSVIFYLITLFFVSYFISKSFFLPDLTSQPPTLCHILSQYIQLSKFTSVLHYFCQIFPLNLLLCQFFPQNCYFLSSFTSEPPSFCHFYLRILFLPDCTSVSSFYQILPQNHLVSVKFYLNTSNFLSDFASKLLYVWFYLESTNICQILPQNPLSFRFYLRTSFLLSVFISEPPSFCQILPQNVFLFFRFSREPVFSVRFYLRSSFFLPGNTSESLSFFHFYLKTSILCILCQIFTLEPPFFLSDLTSNPSTLFRSLSDTHQHRLVKLYQFCIFHHSFFQCCFPALQRKILNRVCEKELHSFPSIAFLQ